TETISHSTSSLQDLAYSLTVGRRRESACVAFVARNRTHLVEMLTKSIASVAGEPSEGVFYAPEPLPDKQRKVAFLFPEHGNLLSQSDSHFSQRFPAFRARLEAIAAKMDGFLKLPSHSQHHTSGNGSAIRASSESSSSTPCNGQPHFAVAQLALVDFFSDLDLRPQVTIGRRLGELIAAATGGILEEQETL